MLDNGRLHASMRVYVNAHMSVYMPLSATRVILSRHTFLLRACTWEKYSRDNERSALESVARLYQLSMAPPRRSYD